MCRVLLYPIIPVCHFSPFEHGLTGWIIAGIGGIRGKNNAESSEQVKAVGMSPLARGKRQAYESLQVAKESLSSSGRWESTLMSRIPLPGYLISQ
jgi:hypothetical protein